MSLEPPQFEVPLIQQDGTPTLEGYLFFLGLFEQSGTGGSGTGDLLSSNNLSDLSSIATARNNLGLGVLATADPADYATVASLATVATTGSYNDLTDLPVSSGGSKTGVADWTPPTAAQGWSTVAGHGATVEAGFDAATNRVRLEKSGGTGSSWLLTSIPSGTTHTRIMRLIVNASVLTFCFSGVSLRRTANSRAMTFGNFRGFGNYFQNFNNTSFASEGQSYHYLYSNIPPQGVIYVKLESTPTTFQLFVAFDGLEWVPLTEVYTAASSYLGGSPDQFGIYLQTTGMSTDADKNTSVTITGYNTSQQAEI